MYEIDAEKMSFSTLNELIRKTAQSDIVIHNCCGQRYIASGMSGKKITIHGIPGNALGAYLDGSTITVQGNVQDATGDTMNNGYLFIHGNAGDATGYAMRGGTICIQGNTGYRCGVHMKEYGNQIPKLLIGGKAGSFLGEYQAGGVIAVFNLTADLQRPSEEPAVGNFCGSGMHGGVMFIRGESFQSLPPQVAVKKMYYQELPTLHQLLDMFCTTFPQTNRGLLENSVYSVLTPNTDNPYKQLYTNN